MVKNSIVRCQLSVLSLLLSEYESHTRKVDRAIIVSINLVNHVLQLRLRGVLAERAHNSAQLLGGDLACNSN